MKINSGIIIKVVIKGRKLLSLLSADTTSVLVRHTQV